MENNINLRKLLKKNHLKINYLFNLFLVSINFNFIFTNDCIISNNTVITNQWLNNIICLGDKDFRYVNFASFSNGSMIVEATSIPDSPKRMFYGIQSDG